MNPFYVENAHEINSPINGIYQAETALEVVRNLFPNALDIFEGGEEKICQTTAFGFDVLDANESRIQLFVSLEKLDWKFNLRAKLGKNNYKIEPLSYLTV